MGRRRRVTGVRRLTSPTPHCTRPSDHPNRVAVPPFLDLSRRGQMARFEDDGEEEGIGYRDGLGLGQELCSE